MAKQEGAGFLVWAASIEDLRPLDVEVRLVSSRNQVLGAVHTDAAGLARIAPAGDDETGKRP